MMFGNQTLICVCNNGKFCFSILKLNHIKLLIIFLLKLDDKTFLSCGESEYINVWKIVIFLQGTFIMNNIFNYIYYLDFID